jgi:hypothetical protein
MRSIREWIEELANLIVHWKGIKGQLVPLRKILLAKSIDASIHMLYNTVVVETTPSSIAQR